MTLDDHDTKTIKIITKAVIIAVGCIVLSCIAVTFLPYNYHDSIDPMNQTTISWVGMLFMSVLFALCALLVALITKRRFKRNANKHGVERDSGIR